MPDEPGKQELLDGELISLPPAKVINGRQIHSLFYLLCTVVPDDRVFMAVGYRIKRGWLQPDVSINWPDQPIGEWFEAAPMIAIEVASRGNTDEEIDRKVEAYLEEGAAEVWIVRPKTASMMVYRKDSAVRIIGVYDCELIGIPVDIPKLLQA